MQIKQICFFVLMGILTASSLYLTYLAATTNLPLIFKLRFINFIVEHLLGMLVLVKRQYYCDEQDTSSHLKWMIGFTGINFLNFVAVEVYGMATKKHDESTAVVETIGANFIALSYCHLYFQVNIYLGVFCLFSMVMGVVFLINQRRHREEVQQVLEQLQTEKYQEIGKQQNCSICLSQFVKEDEIYKLVCGHTFHKQCLSDWFKQKLTCPMCRNNVGRPGNVNNSEFISDISSQQGDRRQNWQQDHFFAQNHQGNQLAPPIQNIGVRQIGNAQLQHQPPQPYPYQYQQFQPYQQPQQVPEYIRRAVAQAENRNRSFRDHFNNNS